MGKIEKVASITVDKIINVDFKIRSIDEENELSALKSVVDAKFKFVALENNKTVDNSVKDQGISV